MQNTQFYPSDEQVKAIIFNETVDAAELARLRREDVERPVFYIGTGTCGLGAGAGKTLDVLKDFLRERDMDAEVIEVGCIGLCAMEPMLDIQLPGKPRLSFCKVTASNVRHLIETVMQGGVPESNFVGQYRQKGVESLKGHNFIDEYPFFAPQTRWVLANCGKINPGSIIDYIAFGGYRALAKTIGKKSQLEVCEEVLASGLKGRGGAGFLTGLKWKFAQKEEASQKYMVCNADEGDPGAFMDRAVIESDPHRLLEGLILAAYAIGASKAYIYIRAEYPLAIRRLQEAISQAKAFNFLGENILGRGYNLDIIIKQGAGAFVCGEETALLRSIEGQRGMPTPRPPFPAIKGLFGKPTVINNVETLANIAEILARGAEWFSSIGTAGSKGTKVFALSGKVNKTGLVEVAIGTPMRRIIEDIGGGVANGKAFKAAQIGGPSGGCIPAQHLDIEVDYQTLQEVGAIMGSGGLVVMDEDTCMVDVAKFFMDFIQRESCGKCTPCREGTMWMLEILKNITELMPDEPGEILDRYESIAMLEDLAHTIKDASLCGLGQTAPNPVLSTLRWFRHEYLAHIEEQRCPSLACKGLLTYTIDEELCRGCTICARKCPVEAITGARKEPHFISQTKCIRCGNCLGVCPVDAIVVQ